MTWILGLSLSALIGVALGLLGGGGSILTVPILLYVFHLEAHQAIATSLLVVGTTSLFALLPHARAGRVRWQTGATFGLASMLGAWSAGRVAHLIPPTLLLLGFAAMMVVTAIAMLRKGRAPAPLAQEPAPEASPLPLPLGKILLEGLAVGAVTGLVGAGGGFLVVPALTLLGGLPMPVAVGTSLLVIAMKSYAALAGYLSTTAIPWRLAGAVTGSAVAGSFVGAKLAGLVPPDRLRQGFGFFVIVMAFFILSQELPKLWAPVAPALGH